MARLFGLILLLLVAAGVFAPEAYAVTRAAARAECEADGAEVRAAVPEVNNWTCRDEPNTTPGATDGWFYCTYKFTWSDGSTGGPYGCAGYAPIARNSYYYDEPDIDCDSLNASNPPGPRLCVAENCGTRCVPDGSGGGCALEVTDPLATIPGRVHGQPVVYYQFAQQYSGDTCTPGAPPTDEFMEHDDGRECVPELGVCVTADGENEYCTFNSDGTPSTCVPAVDYDNDGIEDPDDTIPDDAENGGDDGEGDESDNTAGGGAKCPHNGGQPPSCTGDAIQCNALLQAYLMRCATEKREAGIVSGGIACSTDAPLVCTNLSPGDCFLAAMAKKAACASDAVADAFGAAGSGEAGPEVDPMSAWQDAQEGGDGEFELDESGWLGSRSCPALPSVAVMGITVDYNEHHATICSFLGVFAMLTLLLAGYHCMLILGET